MCQIQFIRKKGECLTPRDIAEFFKLMELGSIDNNCAFGFFNDKVFHKHKGRFHLGRFQKHSQLLNTQFIVGHNRLATTGHKGKSHNNHPFRLNDFTLVHNGTINNNDELRFRHNIQSAIETDSYAILWLINHYFEKSDIRDRQQRICSAIQKTAQKLSGSFSVFLYDRVSDDLYYFKNGLTSFAFCLFDDSVLIGSTNPVNLEHAYLNNQYLFDTDLFKKRTIKRVESDRIYLVDKDLCIKELGRFESQENYSVWGYPYSDHTFQDVDIAEYMAMTTDEKIELAFKNCFGYVPDFSFSESTGLVKVKHDKDILSDLQCFIPNLLCQDKHIFFDAEDLLSNLEEVF